MLAWYRAQTPERQAMFTLAAAVAMVLAIVIARLAGLPWWVAMGIAVLGLVVQLVLRRARLMT